MSGTPPSTPKAQPTPLSCPDTVPRVPHTSQSRYRTRDLTEGRRAVLNDLQKYLEIDYEQLLRSRFGTYPDCVKLAEMRGKMQADGLISTDRDQWSKFTDSPSKCRSNEARAFQPLEDIISTIFEKTKTSFVFEMTPNETPSSTRGNTSRPDAVVRRKELWRPDNKLHWFDIAIPLEFKKSVSGRQDNERKVIWSLHNIMREDPLRRFALGITIEDTDLRIWCIDRALLAVSTPINVITDIDRAISLFLLIAQRTDVGLGWDPTVKRNKDGTYEFTISGKKYITIEELSTCGADVTVSRGTRVYKAKDENGNVVAIKDSWRDSTREHEGSIVEKIHEDIKKRFEEDEAEKAKKFLVRVRTYEDVQISGEPDKTLDPGEGGTWIEINGDPVLSQRLHLLSTGHIPESGHRSLLRMRFPAENEKGQTPCRVHAHIVFDDVGIALMHVSNLEDSLSCLSGARQGLYYLHLSGWVHRDFSVSNVLWVEDKPSSNCFTGKLTDFEFAKRVDSETSHEVRTGTVHFMAIEVETQSYQFRPGPEILQSLPLDMSAVNLSPPPPAPAFRMNPLHDLESMWWAAIWILFYYTDKNCPVPNFNAQLDNFDLAFPCAIGQRSRLTFFSDTDKLNAAYATLSETYRDKCGAFTRLALVLRLFYGTVEHSFDLPICERLLKLAHDEASKTLSDTIGTGVCIELRPLKRTKRNADDSPTQESKRAKQESG